MTDLVVLPDVEAIVSLFLRNHDAVTELVEQRVYGVVPENDDALLPLLKLSQFDSAERVLGWLDGASIQIDAYAASHGNDLATKAQASLVGRTARAALEQLTGTVPGGVVTGVTTAGWRYEPDRDFTPARHRYTFTAVVHAHPLPPTGS